MSDSADLVPPADIVVLGKVVGAYGLRGAVKIHPFADDPNAWGKLTHWWIGQDGLAPSLWRQTRVLKCREHGEVLVADLECFPDRNASESAKGVLVGAPRAVLPATDKDEFYWADLIGLSVVNTADEALGQVAGLLETGANDVLRVVAEDGVERLLPFVDAVVLSVDKAAGRILVAWGSDW